MRANRHIIHVLFSLILIQAGQPVFSQLGFDLNIEKPKEYEDRVLRSEKTDKKFNKPRRFVQNTVTHFNYAFNASIKINEVLDRAKSVWKDDYSTLLSFYNYSLDVTAMDSIQLDSITYKASSGIALHDLRNDWVDNLYLLWGASYYLQKDFDSAYQMFQFINYAFAPKEKGGYYRTIGSARDGNSALSISTTEKGGLVRKAFSRPPSRNDAFIWQIRNYLAQDLYAEASSLIVTLRDDPAFPDRLRNDLHEVQALQFYKQRIWDSAAWHLERALSNAGTQQERARWEYLAGQLWENAGNYAAAEKNYSRSISRTTDLVMEIYARLAAIRTNKEGGESDIRKNVDELVKMAKRDKYAEYQDIIYYMAAQMQLEGNNIDEALALLIRSTQAQVDNPVQKNKAFLQLADISFARKAYKDAFVFYDSVNLDDPAIREPEKINSRKTELAQIVQQLEIIARQDSLQRVAALPEDERKDFVRKLVRQIRKSQGLKDEQPLLPIQPGIPGGNMPPPSLFAGDGSKGEWYFYNSSTRNRGQNEFKARWGNRPNVDNWRRAAAIVNNRTNVQGGITGDNPDGKAGDGQTGGTNFDDLYDRLPLTEEKMQQSNDSIQQAMFALGLAYIRGIEDCEAGTATLEALRNRFPDFNPMDELLFSLYYCYNRAGDQQRAAGIKKMMQETQAASNYTTIVTTGKNPGDANGNTDAQKAYEVIYDLFIEGRFEEAVKAKNIADSLYGNSAWTPRLLYIESVYYIRNRDDEKAKTILNNIINRFPKSPLASRSETMLDVLARRSQIEDELRNLQITRYSDSATAANTQPEPVIPVQQTVVQLPVTKTTVQPADTVKTAPVPVTTAPAAGKDSVKTATATPAFVYKPDDKYVVFLLLNKVDPVFVNEAKNAFFRYNRETYYNKTYSADLRQLNDTSRLLLIAPFSNEQEALTYIEKTAPRTATEIIPWLKNGKYSFGLIAEPNLQVLLTGKEPEAYKRFMDQHWPGKF